MSYVERHMLSAVSYYTVFTAFSQEFHIANLRGSCYNQNKRRVIIKNSQKRRHIMSDNKYYGEYPNNESPNRSENGQQENVVNGNEEQRPNSNPNNDGYRQNGYNNNGYNNNGYNNNGYNNNGYKNNGYKNNGYNNGNPNGPFHQPIKNTPNNLVITSFVISIVSYLLCCCAPSGNYLLIIGSVVAIVLAILSKKGQKMHGLAIAAIVLGVIGILFGIVFTLILVWIMTDPTFMNSYLEMLRQMGIDTSDLGFFLHLF